MGLITSIELRQRDVINLCDGARIGCITDIEFDSCTGQISALILSSGGLFSFLRECRIALPWNRIECIGEDAILVKISNSEYDAFFKSNKKRKTLANDSK